MIPNTLLDHRPTESELIYLLQHSQTVPGQTCWVSWFARTESSDSRLTLKVTSFTTNERNAWSAARETLDGEPEWQLLAETINTRSELWKIRSGDIALISSMTIGPQQSNSFTAKPGADSLKSAVLNRIGLAQAAQNSASVQQRQGSLVLAGNIQDVEIASILQSISISGMTGRLDLQNFSQSIELYFDNGELKHATASSGLSSDDQITGDKAALTLFALTEGTFKFQHGWKTAQRSVQSRLDGILMEGATLQDYKSYLKGRNITLSTLLSVNPARLGITEAEFEQILKDGIPVHIDLQKRVFLALKNAQTLDKIVQDLRIPNLVWPTVIYNLLKLNLIITAT